VGLCAKPTHEIQPENRKLRRKEIEPRKIHRSWIEENEHLIRPVHIVETAEINWCRPAHVALTVV